MKVQLATENDVFQISQLYFDVYQGSYPEPLMKDFNLIRNFIRSDAGFWFITKNRNQEIVGSVLAVYDKENRIAKAFGAVVRVECRGHGMMEDLLSYGINYLKEHTDGVDVFYSTTRTVNEAAQTLTEKLGFKKLGIFPNAHRTNDYETHCLAAIISQEALEKRHTDYKIHHDLASLYNVVQNELGIEPIESIVPDKPSKDLIFAGRFRSYKIGEICFLPL